MSLVSTSTPGVHHENFQFRCIACGDLSDAARQDFRCGQCGDLLEITYPSWKNAKPDAEKLKSTWQKRSLSPSRNLWRWGAQWMEKCCRIC